MGKRAVISVRVSDDKRKGSIREGLGVKEQIKECRERVLEPRGYELAGVFSDNDFSAYSGKSRPEYLRMLDFLRAGKADVVVCWHTDRLHRDNTELEDYIKVVEPREITTETVVAGTIDLNTPIGRMVARNLCTIARYESEHRAERVRLARKRQAREGRYGGGRSRPFGFAPDGVTPIPEEADMIARWGAAVLSGVSLKSIARDLRQAGVVTSRGTRFSPEGVREVLLRPRNAGLMIYRESTRTQRRYTDDDIVGKAPWEPLMPEEMWRALVAKLTDPERRTNPGGRAVKYLGSGIYLCRCGTVMRASKSGSNAHRPIYRCTETRAGHVAIGVEEMDEYVERVVVTRLARMDAADFVSPRESGIDVVDLRTQLAAHRARLDEIAADREADRITRSQMLTMTETRRAKITEIEDQLAMATDVSPLAPMMNVDPADIAKEWDKRTLGEKRAIMRVLMTVTVLPAGRGCHPDVKDRVRIGAAQPAKDAV